MIHAEVLKSNDLESTEMDWLKRQIAREIELERKNTLILVTDSFKQDEKLELEFSKMFCF